ncbi:MAG TPA: hypothetical protein VFN13_11340 [Rudaea sp.]|nr:hypothetical protein [Rudaea sp.]
MYARILLISILCIAATACGKSANEAAAAACGTEIAKQMGNKNYHVDLGDLASHAKSESADTVLMHSTVVIDKGLSTESRQTYECRARVDKNGKASVLFLQFNWNTSDLKKPG